MFFQEKISLGRRLLETNYISLRLTNTVYIKLIIKIMAYEKEIKTALKNKYHSTLGLRDNAYEAVANILGATPNLTEDQIGNVVDGAEVYLKVIQSETDVARKTAKKDPQQTEPKPSDPPKTDPKPTDNDTVAKLLERIEKLERKEKNEGNRARLISKLEEKKVDKAFYEAAIEGREFGSDEEIDAYVDKLATSYGNFSQSLADKGLSNIPKPILGASGENGVSSGVQAYIDSKSKDSKSSLGGKEI